MYTKQRGPVADRKEAQKCTGVCGAIVQTLSLPSLNVLVLYAESHQRPPQRLSVLAVLYAPRYSSVVVRHRQAFQVAMERLCRQSQALSLHSFVAIVAAQPRRGFISVSRSRRHVQSVAVVAMLSQSPPPAPSSFNSTFS
ncbi:hypothetical protein KP509_09G070500 [Ceratopteris richardii]|uniref:Uncharacterized protein n=1 Tax=Ceratopteris richardii TaxID=49495 RepID=A0A8T2U2D8_CERRI|nr:hypothetical protein KP509_09G070500 [Ceratopteris richardii]